MSAKIPIMIATPMKDLDSMGSQHPFHRVTLEEMKLLDESPYEFSFAVMEGGISHARNKMVNAAKALDPMPRRIVWWDADLEPVGGNAAGLLRLLSHKQPIVSAGYTRKSDAESCRWVANFMHEVEPQQDLLQVVEAGGGFMSVHMQVYENLERMFPTLVYTDRDSGERISAFYQQVCLQTDLKPDGDWLPEDFFFCHCCRHANIGIWWDTVLHLRHHHKGQVFPKNDEWPPIPIDEPAPRD